MLRGWRVGVFTLNLMPCVSPWYHLHGCLAAKYGEPVYWSSRWTCARLQCHIRSISRCATYVYECGWRDVKIQDRTNILSHTLFFVFYKDRGCLFFRYGLRHSHNLMPMRAFAMYCDAGGWGWWGIPSFQKRGEGSKQRKTTPNKNLFL